MFLACIWCVLGDVWCQIDTCFLDDRLAFSIEDGEAQLCCGYLGETDDFYQYLDATL